MRCLPVWLWCTVGAVTLPAAAAPYPAYIERQIQAGTLSTEEAQLLITNGLGQPARPVRIPPQTIYPGPVVPTYDPLAASQAEAAYYSRLNDERFSNSLAERDQQYYWSRSLPATGVFPRFYRRRFPRLQPGVPFTQTVRRSAGFGPLVPPPR